MEDIRNGVCPLCRHNRIIRGETGDAVLGKRFHLALAKRTTRMTAPEDYGVLYICACQRCGFSQLFAEAPQNVPISEEFGTSLIEGPEPAGPYR